MFKNGSIFTTRSYSRSPKRINYCALLYNGEFFFIDFVACSQKFLSSNVRQCILFGKIVGTISKQPLCPPEFVDRDSNRTNFDHISGSTAVLDGCSDFLVGFHSSIIYRKAVVTSIETSVNPVVKKYPQRHCDSRTLLVDRFTITALPNTFESD